MSSFSHLGVNGELTMLPGCGQIIVSHNVWSKHPGQGNGTRANAARLLHAKELGHEYILCTVNIQNLRQRRIMEKNGWEELSEFFSEKSNTTIIIYGQPL